jgi:hypothetical protein
MQNELTEMKINFSGDFFQDCREQINRHIQKCLPELEAGRFEAGTVTMKMDIELVPDVYKKPVRDAITGGVDYERIDYLRPTFDYKVQLSLAKKEASSGGIHTAMELVNEGGEFYVRKAGDGQMTFDDVEPDVVNDGPRMLSAPEGSDEEIPFTDDGDFEPGDEEYIAEPDYDGVEMPEGMSEDAVLDVLREMDLQDEDEEPVFAEVFEELGLDEDDEQ